MQTGKRAILETSAVSGSDVDAVLAANVIHQCWFRGRQ